MLMDQLPFIVRNQIFCEYLFKNFIEKYSNIFGMRQLQVRRRRRFLRMFSMADLGINISFFDPDKIV